MSAASIDLNTDCGESFGSWRMGDDRALLARVSSANVACGFHAGDPLTLLATVDLALEHGCVVGAHPGLPDLLGFGRRAMAITPEDAYAYVVYQVGALSAALGTRGARLHHVKPHGCLMSMVADDAAIADAVAAAIADTCAEPCVYYTAPLERGALPAAAQRHGVRVVAEVYPDLAYDDDANVVIERAKHAVDPAQCAARLQDFLDHGRVRTLSGAHLALEADSVCVHGDGPNAVAVVDALRAVLADRGVACEPPPAIAALPASAGVAS